MNTLDDLKTYAPKAATYLDHAGRAILAATLSHDYARASEKMVDPNCAGENNPAWQTGPFLNVFHGGQPISRTSPSVLQGGVESLVAAQIVYGDDNERINLPEIDDAYNQVDHIQAKLAIIEQAELLRKFMQSVGGPTGNKETDAKQSNQTLEAPLQTLQQIYERAEDLLLNPTCDPASMREAVDIFYAATQTAAEISAQL